MQALRRAGDSGSVRSYILVGRHRFVAPGRLWRVAANGWKICGYYPNFIHVVHQRFQCWWGAVECGENPSYSSPSISFNPRQLWLSTLPEKPHASLLFRAILGPVRRFWLMDLAPSPACRICGCPVSMWRDPGICPEPTRRNSVN